MKQQAEDSWTASCDVLVVGSGAGGLATAITARLHGLDVRVVEKDALLGGGTALSFGTLWVPGNSVAAGLGIEDDRASAYRYLEQEMGARFDPDRVGSYLDHAPRVMEFFEQNSAVRFECREDYPDYHPDFEGASLGGRTLFVAAYDGRELGADIARLRPPLPGQTVMGMMYTPKEVKYLQSWSRSATAFSHVMRRLLRHWSDVARHGRTMWLTNGNALAARLLRTALDLKIPIETSTSMRRLIVADGRVAGAVVESGGRERTLIARRGVVLACGGFGHDLARCRELFSRPQLDGQNWSMAPPTNDGDGIRQAEAVGGQIDRGMLNAGFWSPVSRVPHRGGILSGHYHERQRPGFIAVTAKGKRFANEALSYHHFGEAIINAAEPGCEPEAFMVCDHASIRRTGCGNVVFPRPFPLTAHLRSGYLMRADTVAGLAQAAGIDAAALERTVEEFNRHAREGRDPQFGKGDNIYNRYFGDTRQQPNPCVGPLDRGPYYAVRITAAHMATLAGTKTNGVGGVLDHDGVPIPGLYAAGNDMANVFGGSCPGGGITLGPALTFGYLTGRHLAHGSGAAPGPRAEGRTRYAPAPASVTPAL